MQTENIPAGLAEGIVYLLLQSLQLNAAAVMHMEWPGN